MNKKTIGMIAGGLGFAFACAAGLWSFYPENRETAADLFHSAAVSAGLAEPPSAAPHIRNFIEAGFLPPAPPAQNGIAVKPPAPAYMADMAAQACSADRQIVRLAYGVAFIADDKRDEILVLPQIAGNQEQYAQQRRAAVTAFMESSWQAEIAGLNASGKEMGAVKTLTGLNFRDPRHGDSLQTWLNEQAQELYRQTGLKIALRVNAASGAQILAPRSDAIDACTPAGHMPKPLGNARPGEGTGPRPF